MRTEDFLIKELRDLILTDAKKSFADEKCNEIADEIIQKVLELEDVADIFKIKVLKRLPNVKFIIENFIRLDDEDDLQKVDIYVIDQIFKNNPKNNLNAFIWIKYKVLEFEQEGYFDLELGELFSLVFEKVDAKLINLHDFLLVTGLFALTFDEAKVWNIKIFENIFKKAILKFPEKYQLHKMLAQIYLTNKRYKECVNVLNLFLDKIALIEYEDGDYGRLSYLETFQQRAIANYKLGNVKIALKDCDFVTRNLPILKFNDGEESMEFVDYFMDAFFIRMTENLRIGNLTAIKKDVDRVVINTGIDLTAWKHEYIELFEYCEKHYPEMLLKPDW